MQKDKANEIKTQNIDKKTDIEIESFKNREKKLRRTAQIKPPQ